MNALLMKLGGKKIAVTILGFAGIALLLIAKKLGFATDTQTIQQVIQAIIVICSTFHIGQGFADGLSDGKTSHAAQAVNAALEDAPK